jgi:hypothetical protein
VGTKVTAHAGGSAVDASGEIDAGGVTVKVGAGTSKVTDGSIDTTHGVVCRLVC